MWVKEVKVLSMVGHREPQGCTGRWYGNWARGAVVMVLLGCRVHGSGGAGRGVNAEIDAPSRTEAVSVLLLLMLLLLLLLCSLR
jgi:hypothetical protein